MSLALPGFFRTLGFDPLSLSPVIWFDMDTSMLAAGDVAATEGDMVATLDNKVSGGPDATQTVSSEQSVAKIPVNGNPPYLLMDLVDDEYEFTTGGSAINGTIVVATLEGTYSANISLNASTQYDLQARGVSSSANVGFLKNVIGYLITPSQLSDSEITKIEAYFVGKGAAARSAFGGVTEFTSAWYGCTSLTSFPLINTSSGTRFDNAWYNCSLLTSFPLIDTSSATNVLGAWRSCSSLASFPLIATSSVTNFINSWRSCSSLTSFPAINTSSGTSFDSTWRDCSSLTSFPLLNTSSGTNFSNTWRDCTSLTSFPLINTSSGTTFTSAWNGCTSLTSFPLIDTSSATNFNSAWRDCTSLTSFPLIDTSSMLLLTDAWRDCSSLASFPSINVNLVRDFKVAWRNCSSLVTFPANLFDDWSPSSVTNATFNLTWDGCTSLTAQSVENILTSLDTSGVYGTNTGLVGGTQLADNTIDIDYDGTTLSGATTTAITSLKSKNWAISINSVIQ